MKWKVAVLLGTLSNSLSALSQEVIDTTKVVTLDEVVVKAERIIHKADHDVLYLSKDNRAFGTNALDAVSSLELFQTSSGYFVTTAQSNSS